MSLTEPENWRPSGIDDLEPNAWQALRSFDSACVVAGPGAGKTEFLAQRATYLLQTGICRPPYKILAISFKRDAAENLAERVRMRCPPNQASRFVSVTFDSFTKSLLDRFHAALPGFWQPSIPYEVCFPNNRQVRDFLTLVRSSAPPEWQPEIAGINSLIFEAQFVGGQRLGVERSEPSTGLGFATQNWWQENLRRGDRSALTFIMINRLAELLLRFNPYVLRSLRATYPFVFVDEFQDTTYAQYDFLLSAFMDERTVVTAVGDDKQRIMEWAGARVDAFSRMSDDFHARRIPLLMNFRSSPDLVQIQQVVALALDADSIEMQAKSHRTVDGEVAQIWTFRSEEAESNQLADWLAEDMGQRGTLPRDYAILVRQTADRFENQLSSSFASCGLSLRNESKRVGRTTLQDLLAERLTVIAITLLRLGIQGRAPEAWTIASEAISHLRSADPDDFTSSDQAERELSEFLSAVRVYVSGTPLSVAAAEDLGAQLLAFLDPSALARTYMEYGVGDNLDIASEALSIHLASSANGVTSWEQCLDAFEGVGQIPLMTVHKSKGLEFDTILFVGLDDNMWWSHTAGNPEGIATFFVALSRAKQRAIFTFCQARGRRSKVADLYQLLGDAGVPEVEY